MKRLYLLSLIIGTIISTIYADDTPAFPGAEGYGRYASGGRGGRVIHVTNLNDSGEGSLRRAIEQSGARIIVFDVSGTIELQSCLTIRNGNITIAGQTAPGDGICLKNYGIHSSADNVIIRFIRSRLGDEHAQEDDAMTGINHNNIIIDHCTMSWATDETASFYDNSNFTMQWCLITESLNNSVHVKGRHGYGGLWVGKGASFHHNLLAHHINRHPLLCGSRYSCRPDLERVDLRNNVVYNWGPSNNSLGGAGGVYNYVNNYYKPGPSTATKAALIHRICAPDDGIADTTIQQKESTWGKFYLSGNHFDASCPDVRKVDMAVYNLGMVNSDNWHGMYIKDTLVAKTDSLKSIVEFETAPVTLHDARTTYRKVLAHAGASFIRDTIDRRVTAEVEGGYYTYEGSKGSSKGIIDSQTDVGGYISYNSAPRLRDSDNDGIPDAWERANGLDPRNAEDASTPFPGAGGYTSIEVYINSLVEEIMKAGNAGAIKTLDEFYPEYIRPEYTASDYYAEGESYETERNLILNGGTNNNIMWQMDNLGPKAYATPEGFDTEMSISELSHTYNYGYLAFGSEQWCEKRGYNDSLYIDYSISAIGNKFFAIDSISLYARRQSTDYIFFSACYDTVETMTVPIYLATETKPSRDDFEYISMPLRLPLVIAPGQQYILRLHPYNGYEYSSIRYPILFKNVTIHGRIGTKENIITTNLPAVFDDLSPFVVCIADGTLQIRHNCNVRFNTKIELLSLDGNSQYFHRIKGDSDNNTISIPLKNLHHGVYLCRITCDTATYTHKVIIN